MRWPIISLDDGGVMNDNALRAAQWQRLVVDDGEEALDWAATAGARTVLCGPNGPSSAIHAHVERLARLPKLLVRS